MSSSNNGAPMDQPTPKTTTSKVGNEDEEEQQNQGMSVHYLRTEIAKFNGGKPVFGLRADLVELLKRYQQNAVSQKDKGDNSAISTSSMTNNGNSNLTSNSDPSFNSTTAHSSTNSNWMDTNDASFSVSSTTTTTTTTPITSVPFAATQPPPPPAQFQNQTQHHQVFAPAPSTATTLHRTSKAPSPRSTKFTTSISLANTVESDNSSDSDSSDEDDDGDDNVNGRSFPIPMERVVDVVEDVESDWSTDSDAEADMLNEVNRRKIRQPEVPKKQAAPPKTVNEIVVSNDVSTADVLLMSLVGILRVMYFFKTKRQNLDLVDVNETLW